jgi:hypothetical protein
MFKKNANEHEMGYLKVRFFDAITIFKPSVSIITFDWSNLPVGQFAWPDCESFVLEEL